MTGDDRLQILIDAGFTPEELEQIVGLLKFSVVLLQAKEESPPVGVPLTRAKSEALGRYILQAQADGWEH